jgi:hypothetical protein
MAAKRKVISKRIRFEVFKRDGFACQYCGKKAPDALLTIDHISPVSKNGAHDILNFVTACEDCNSGKGARELDDQSILAKQMAQLSVLGERREQLKLMVKWRDGLKQIEEDKLALAVQRIDALQPGWKTNQTGRARLSVLLNSVPFDLVCAAIDEGAKSIVLNADGFATEQSIAGLYERIARIATVMLRDRKNPGMGALYYIRGIARKRWHGHRESYNWRSIALLKEARDAGVSVDALTQVALGISSFAQFESEIEDLIIRAAGPGGESEK